MSTPRKSSSSFIFGALRPTNTNEATENKENDDLLIKIPQKCYGFITPDTPSHIKGFFTDGLYTCSGIALLAHNTNNDYIFFCHADSETNLASTTHGVPSWLNKVPSHLDQITINYDNALDGEYKRALEKIRDDAQKTTSKVITLAPYDGDLTEMVAIRGEAFNRSNSDKIYNAIDKFDNDSSDVVEHLHSIVEYKFENQLHDPICVYDSKKILMTEDIIKSQAWITKAIEQSNQKQDVEIITETEEARESPSKRYG